MRAESFPMILGLLELLRALDDKNHPFMEPAVEKTALFLSTEARGGRSSATNFVLKNRVHWQTLKLDHD